MPPQFKNFFCEGVDDVKKLGEFCARFERRRKIIWEYSIRNNDNNLIIRRAHEGIELVHDSFHSCE